MKKNLVKFTCIALLFSLSANAQLENQKEQTKSSLSANELLKKGQESADLFTIDGYTKAIEYFTQAYQKDSKLTKALASKARVQSLLGLKLKNYKNSYKTIFSEKQIKEFIVSPENLLKQSKENINLLLKQKTALAEAHHNLAIIYCYDDKENSDCDKEVKSTVKLNPKNPEIYYLSWIGNSETRKNNDLSLIKKSLSINPKYIPSLYIIGKDYIQQKKYKEATNTFNQILKISPDYSQAYYRLGMINLELNQYKQGEDNVNKAITLFPLDELYYELRGKIYLKENKLEQSLADFKKASELLPEEYYYHSQIARVYTKMGKDEEALSELKIALSMDPNKAFYYSRMGDIYFDRNDYSQALINYKKAFSLEPDQLDYFSMLLIYDEKKDLKAQEELLKKLPASMEIDKSKYHYYYSKFYNNQNKLAEALKEAKKAVDLNSKNYLAQSLLGDIYYKQNDLKNSVKAYENSYKVDPFYLTAEKLGINFIKLNDYNNALVYLKHALNGYEDEYKSNPGKAYDNFYVKKIGLILIEQKKYEEGMKYFKKGLELTPEDLDLILYVNQSYIEQKKYNELMAFCLDKITQMPDTPELYSDLGVSYIELEQYDKALESLNYAVKLNPKLAVAHHNLGRAYTKTGKYNEAMKEYEEACKLGLTSTCDFIQNNNVQVG